MEVNAIAPARTVSAGPVTRLARLSLIWERPLSAAIVAFVVYLALSFSTDAPLLQGSTTPYFNYLADAFLHGQLSLRLTPPLDHDLVIYQGKLFLYWPPLPALLLLPLVAVFGVGVSDVLIALLLAAANVGLVALLLRYACVRRLVRLSPMQRGLLVLFFTVGTVHMTLAPFGRVWAVGQLVAFNMTLLAYLAVLARSGWPAFLLCGAALAGAMLTRNHTLFVGVWPGLYLLYQHRSAGVRRLLAYTALAASPIVIGGVLLLIYNWLRFGSPTDNGLAYHNLSWFFVEDFERYGVFHVHYLWTNIYYQLLFYPLPFRDETVMGGSLFLLSPVFFGAFVGWRNLTPRWYGYALIVSIVLVLIPIMLLMGTGWTQFGPRYTLDFTVPLLLLTAAGVRRWPPSRLVVLIIISFAHYLVGTIALGSLFN